MSDVPRVGSDRLKPLVRAAIQNGNLALVADYLARGGEINARDQRGRTPLMLAASRGHTELCRLLLEKGADCSDQDEEGLSVLEIARHEGGQDVVVLIESHLCHSDRDPIPEEPDLSASALFDTWQPETLAEAPIEDTAVRAQVLGCRDIMRAGPPVVRDADWSDVAIDLPDVDGLAIEREFQRHDIRELLAALIGEALQRGAYRPSLAATLAIELDGSLDGDLFQNVSQMLGDIGFLSEDDEDKWGHGNPVGENWDSDDVTEDCLIYLRDLQSLTNDPYRHLSKDVQLSALLDREGEERVGRLISVAIKDACNAVASDDRVLPVLVDLDKRVEEEPFLAARLSRLEEGSEEEGDVSSDEDTHEGEGTGATVIVSRFRARLTEAIQMYRDTSQNERRRRITAAIERLELTVLGFRTLKKGLASAGAVNELLDSALERATRLEYEMFYANLRLAISVAGKYGWSKLPRMDRIQEAFIGLLKAIGKFDFERGTKFSTYATWWLKQSVTRAIADKERIIRVPVHMLERVNKLASTARAAGYESAHDMPVVKLSSLTGLSEAEVVKTLAVVEDPTLWEDSPEAFSIAMSLADSKESPVAVAERLEMERIVLECVDRLPAREAEIIKHRFGLSDSGEKTLEELGKLHDLTRERIRQIESKALDKLRNRGNPITVLKDYEPERE